MKMRPRAGLPTPHYNPWSHLGELQGRLSVTLLWHDDGPKGETDFSARTISLRRGMTAAERRCTLAHELAHLTRGPTFKGHERVEEVLVEMMAAARLIPTTLIVDLPAMVKRHGQAAARDFLELDDNMLECALSLCGLAETFGWTYGKEGDELEGQVARP